MAKNGWKEIPIGGLITEAGSAKKYNTGDWRTFKPVRDENKCIHCLICWVYCPDSSILVAEGKMVGFDYDDPLRTSYNTHGCNVVTAVEGTHPTIADWTNTLARISKDATHYLICGDDYVMRTPGWDIKLRAECAHGIGAAFPDDGYQHKPTAILVPKAFMDITGYLAWPELNRWFIDAWIEDVCNKAGILTYVPEVLFEHMHHFAGKAAPDPTYNLACINGHPSKEVKEDQYEYGLGHKLRERDAYKLVDAIQKARQEVMT